MNSKLGRIMQAGKKFRTAYTTKRWVRVTVGAFVVIGVFGAGQDSATREFDPRQNVPGMATPVEMLEGKWDGIGTLPDGTVFCMVGWPCEEDSGSVGEGK